MGNKVEVRNCVAVPVRDTGSLGYFYSFRGFPVHTEHFAVSFGEPRCSCPLVRVHSECVTGDLFRSQLCDCGAQLDEAIGRLEAESGYLIYLRQEGRGIGLYAKLDAYALQAQGLDTYEANRRLHFPEDARDYKCAADILKALGIRRVRLLTNNPGKVSQLREHGIEVVEVVPTSVFRSQFNQRYLTAKVEQHHHTMDLRARAQAS